MTENEKNLALSSAKAKVDKLIDWYYIKRSPLLKDFDKEALLGKITFDLLELRGILDGCKYNPFDEEEKVMDERELNPDKDSIIDCGTIHFNPYLYEKEKANEQAKTMNKAIRENHVEPL